MKLLKNYKLATLLNVLGLAVALAAFYLFMTQVIYNKTYNSSIPDAGRTYRVEVIGLFGDECLTTLPMPLVLALEEIPQVKQMQSFVPGFYGETEVKVGENKFMTSRCSMSQSGPAFFGGKIIYGDIRQFNANNIIITRSEAKRIFGKENAVGENLFVERYRQDYTICAVMEDLPENMLLSYGLIYPYTDELTDRMNNWNYQTYLRLDDISNKSLVEQAVLDAFYRLEGIVKGKETEQQKRITFRLVPVEETWFSGVDRNDKGNKDVVNVLLGASIFLIFVALLNLANFSLSLSPVRIKGVNTRKVLGASTASLRFGIIADNVILSLVALIVAVIMVLLAEQSTFLMSLMQGSVSFSSHLPLCIATAIIAFAIGIIAAVYPAWYATSFAPAMVLKGSFALSPQGRLLRSVMLLMQFVISMALVVYVMVLGSQSRYIFNSDYGFDKDEILISELSWESRNKVVPIRSEIEKLPCVEGVTFGLFSIGDQAGVMNWGRGDDEHRMRFYVLPVDNHFLRVHGIEVIEGRDFNESDLITGAYIMNENMMRSYDWLKQGQNLYAAMGNEGSANYEIVGVCKNFKVVSMHTDNSNANVALMIEGPDRDGWTSSLEKVFVRVKAGFDKIEARKELAEVMKQFDPNTTSNFEFLNSRLEQTYKDELRFISQVEVFAFICILITLIGVFCLTMFETEFRRKEIAIRKVLGSTEGEILSLFTSRYFMPLIIAFIVGAPVAYLLSKKWLEGFAEHTPIYWWLFPLALCLVSAIVLLTVVVQSWRVARSNPIEGVRTE